MSSYSNIFKMKRAYSIDLRNDKEFLDYLKAEGFIYIRRHEDRSFDQVLRNPTMGCIVELYQLPYYRSVKIDSPAGRKIINRLCYF
jgi:hypothetical protein